MKTHLLSWNPDKWKWKDIEESIKKLNDTGIGCDIFVFGF